MPQTLAFQVIYLFPDGLGVVVGKEHAAAEPGGYIGAIEIRYPAAVAPVAVILSILRELHYPPGVEHAGFPVAVCSHVRTGLTGLVETVVDAGHRLPGAAVKSQAQIELAGGNTKAR